jgi:hypothetical protein
MTFHIGPNGKSVSRVDLSDDGEAGYRPAVSVDLGQIRACPDRSKAIAEYRKAMASAETDIIYRQPKGLSWSVWLALVLIVGWAVAIVWLWLK